MSMRIVLASGTALGLLMASGAAWAGSSNTYLEQVHDHNSASVDQTAGDGNNFGAETDTAKQNGDHNVIEATQADGSSAGASGLGIDQNFDRNVLTLSQKNGGVDSVQQTSVDGAGATTNTLAITQTDNISATSDTTNRVGSVTQTYSGTTGGADLNAVTIEQSLSNAFVTSNHRNNISSVVQNGTSHSLSITQVSGWNSILEASQTGGSNNQAVVTQGSVLGGHHNGMNYLYQTGSNNFIEAHLNGSSNGGGLSGIARAAAGNYDASLVQTGSDNQASIVIDGDGNHYAIKQQGQGNIATGVSISGNSNELGIGQYIGDYNTVTLADIGGDDNMVGLRQNGDNNEISGLNFGSLGTVDITQKGNWNDTTFSQTGDGNYLKVSIGSTTPNLNGDYNVLNVVQDHSTGAVANTATITITGDHNNDFPAASPQMVGASFSAFLVGHAEDNTFSHQGDLYQKGGNNGLTIEVSTDENAFATYQSGSGNTISHIVNTGNGNMAAIVQIGVGNTSTTIQSGIGNNVGVSQ